MPKLLWREPIETTVITRARDDDAANKPRTSPTALPANRRCAERPQAPTPRRRVKVRVKTLGDIAGRESGALIVLLVAVGALTLASPEFLTGNNLANLARQVAIFGILAIGQLLVILTGGIDLSVGSILGLSGAVTAQLLVAGCRSSRPSSSASWSAASSAWPTACWSPDSSCPRSSPPWACWASPAASSW